MNLDKLKEDVYKIPLSGLRPYLLYDIQTDTGDLIGWLAMRNGIDSFDLDLMATGDFDDQTLYDKLNEVYGLSKGVVHDLSFSFGAHFPEILSHDDLWKITMSVLRHHGIEHETEEDKII